MVKNTEFEPGLFYFNTTKYAAFPQWKCTGILNREKGIIKFRLFKEDTFFSYIIFMITLTDTSKN